MRTHVSITMHSIPAKISFAIQNRLPQSFLRQVACRKPYGWILTQHPYVLERHPPIRKTRQKYHKLMLYKPWVCLSATIRLDEPRLETECSITGDTFHFKELANCNGCYLLTLKDLKTNTAMELNAFPHVTTNPVLQDIWDTIIRLGHSPSNS